MALLASLLVAGAGIGLACDPAEPIGGPALHRAPPEVESRDVALAPDADTYLLGDHPNRNEGTARVLRLSGEDRVLVAWDPPAIAAAIGADSLVAASLELTLAEHPKHWDRHGGQVTLHRLTQAWTEAGATWNCGVDAEPANRRADCKGDTAWEMDRPKALRPFVATPSATARLSPSQRGRGVVRFNVTADVAALAGGGGAQYGWLLKERGEGSDRPAEFGSRESDSPPRLVLTLVPQAQDTSRPAIPANVGMPNPVLTVRDPEDTLDIYFRNVVTIVFDDTTSGTSIRSLLARYRATIIGGSPRLKAYDLQIPDPGITFAALDSVVAALGRELGVASAGKAEYLGRIRLQGRFPNDGPGMTRAAWFDSTGANGPRSRLKVRAPLAWGCETGMYDTSRVRVGTIDLLYATNDLDGSTVQLLPPPEFTPAGDSLFRRDDNHNQPRYTGHGTQFLGIMAATGNNNRGIAGMIWGAALFLFPQGRLVGGHLYRTAWGTRRFAEALVTASDSGVRIFATASQTGSSNDSELVREMRVGLLTYLSGDPRNLFILALGNDRNHVPLSTIQTSTTTTATFRAVAQLYSTNPNQILLVAGTDTSGGRLSTFSDFWSGATEIAAPAESILTLDYPSGVISRSGVSFAAAFVAGVAAQLRAMDPTLTAAQVKGYILRGAREPKGWSTPGVRIPADSVHGAPETVYQLDAYGSLSLLSRERPGTPICGFPVSVSADGKQLVLQRTAPEPLSIALSVDASLTEPISVAQGGRRIAVRRWDGAVGAAQPLETDHHGAILHAVPGVDRRIFLETDTADVISDADGRATVLLSGAAGAHPIPISARLPVPAEWRMGTVIIAPAPDASWFAAFHIVDVPPNLDEMYRLDLFPRDPAGPSVPVYARVLTEDSGPCLLAHDFCDRFGRVDWSMSSQRAWLTMGQIQVGGGVNFHTLVFSVPLAHGVPQVPGAPVTVDDAWLLGLNVLPGDSSVRTAEQLEGGSCAVRLRWATAPARVWADTANAGCTDPGRIFNAPGRIAGRTP